DQRLREGVDLGNNVTLALVDDPLEPLVAFHLQPTGSFGRVRRHRQLVFVGQRVRGWEHGADCRMTLPMTTKRWTLLAAVLGSSVVFLDGIVLNVALPAIGQMPRLFV